MHKQSHGHAVLLDVTFCPPPLPHTTPLWFGRVFRRTLPCPTGDHHEVRVRGRVQRDLRSITFTGSLLSLQRSVKKCPCLTPLCKLVESVVQEPKQCKRYALKSLAPPDPSVPLPCLQLFKHYVCIHSYFSLSCTKISTLCTLYLALKNNVSYSCFLQS